MSAHDSIAPSVHVADQAELEYQAQLRREMLEFAAVSSPEKFREGVAYLGSCWGLCFIGVADAESLIGCLLLIAGYNFGAELRGRPRATRWKRDRTLRTLPWHLPRSVVS